MRFGKKRDWVAFARCYASKVKDLSATSRLPLTEARLTAERLELSRLPTSVE